MKPKLSDHKAIRLILRTLALSFLTSCAGVIAHQKAALAIEEPSFQVIKKGNDFEIREYAPNLVARVDVTGDFDSAGNQGFKILADFIFGNNKAKAKINMTAPVAMSEKIDMTVPVAMAGDHGRYQVEFTMPRKFTKATLPEPNNPQVQIIEVPSKIRAVHKYSGTWSEDEYLKHKTQLISLLKQAGYEPVGEAVFSRFDPPFIPWFLRHNEVWIEVKSNPGPSLAPSPDHSPASPGTK